MKNWEQDSSTIKIQIEIALDFNTCNAPFLLAPHQENRVPFDSIAKKMFSKRSSTIVIRCSEENNHHSIAFISMCQFLVSRYQRLTFPPKKESQNKKQTCEMTAITKSINLNINYSVYIPYSIITIMIRFHKELITIPTLFTFPLYLSSSQRLLWAIKFALLIKLRKFR